MSYPHWYGSHVPYSFDYLNEYTFSQPRKPLVIDDELRELAAKVRERLALVGNHKVAPMYTLAITCLEAAAFYDDSEQLRARLKAEMRDAVGMLDDILTREGTEREREERRAEAIAKDRREIMAYCRQNAHDRDRVKQWHFQALPMRWFDDWSRVRSHYDDEPVVPPRPEGGYRWDCGEKADPVRDLQRVARRTPAEQDAHVRSFQARWPEPNEREKMHGDLCDHWQQGRIRTPTPEENQAMVDEFAEFTRADFDRLARKAKP